MSLYWRLEIIFEQWLKFGQSGYFKSLLIILKIYKNFQIAKQNENLAKLSCSSSSLSYCTVNEMDLENFEIYKDIR